MAVCKVCGCTGWLFFISDKGICRTCAHLTSIDVEQRTRIVRDEARSAETTLNPHSKIAHLDVVVKNLEALADYESKGVPTPEAEAGARLSESRKERDALLLRTAKAELNDVIQRVRKEARAEGKTALYEDLLRRLGEFKARLEGERSLDTMIRKVEGTIMRIRLDSRIRGARSHEKAGRSDAARKGYEEALAFLNLKGAADPASPSYRAKIEERLRRLPKGEE